MRKFAQRAVIAGASVLAITSAVAGTDLLGQAHADDTHCVADATDPCPPPADPPEADPPEADPPEADPPQADPPQADLLEADPLQAGPRQLWTVCMGGGPKTGGEHCFEEMLP